MATAPELHEPQIAAARASAWHQTGDALLTLEAARSWVENFGLVLFAPRGGSLGAPAPSLVEATLGAARPAATLKDSETARTLVARMVGEGSAVPLNLLGGAGDLPDFVVSAQVFPFVFTLRGDKGWKRPPEISGAVKVTPLGLRVYELLSEKGPMTIAEIVPEVGREITDSAVARALNELWQILRVIPVLQQGEGETRWELLTARFLKAVKAGANAGQPTALSGLVSLYLAQSYVASEMEIASFLSPLTARSRVREVLHGLTAARQLAEGVVEGQTVMYIPDALPDFSAFGAQDEESDEVDEFHEADEEDLDGIDAAGDDDQEDEDSEDGAGEDVEDLDDAADDDEEDLDAVTDADTDEGTDDEAAEGNDAESGNAVGETAAPKRIRSFGTKAGGAAAPRSLRGKPLGRGPADRPGREGFAPRSPRPNGDFGTDRPKRSFGAGRPADRSSGGREGFAPRGDRPKRSFGQGESGSDRPAFKRTGAGRPQGGERPRFDRPWNEDRPARPFRGARDEGGASGSEQRPPRFRQEGGDQRPARPFRPREGGAPSGGGRFPRREDRGEGASRPRQGGFAGGGDRPFRPRTEGDRPFRPRTEGGERPFRPRSEGERPFRPRTEGRPYSNSGSGDRPFRPRRDDAAGGGDRPFRPRTEGGDRPFRPRRDDAGGGGDRFRSGEGRPPRFGGGEGRPPRREGSDSRPPRSFGAGGGKPFGARRPEGGGDRPSRPFGAGRPARDGAPGQNRAGAPRSGGFGDRPRGGAGGFRPGGKPGGFRKGPPAGGGFGGGRPGGSGFAPRGKRSDRPEGRRSPEDEG